MQDEDYEEEGLISVGALRECFETLDLLGEDKIDAAAFDYIVFLLFQKSEGLARLRYQPLFDMLEEKLLQSQFSAGSEGVQARKRPESSSPQKLKARNKGKRENTDARAEAEEDDYAEEFEQLLDKDDENDNEKSPSVAKQGREEDEEDYIDEEQMLDIAEQCFVKIAEAIIKRGLTVRQAFKGFVVREELEEGQFVELLSPVGFLEGVKALGLTDLAEVEVACLMRVLTKADLENAILVKELVLIMENFGILDEEAAEAIEERPVSGEKPKRKKKGEDLSRLDKESLDILVTVMLALMEWNVSLYELFEGAIFEQQVKTKTKQKTLELIKAADFFGVLAAKGVLPSA